jgi:hypothetical protein
MSIEAVVQMLMFSGNILQTHPERMFYHLFRHPLAQSRGHIKLTITQFEIKYSFLECIQPPMICHMDLGVGLINGAKPNLETRVAWPWDM